MSLRIACDLDGTLADMESALQREAVALFGPNVDIRATAGQQPAAEAELESGVSRDAAVSTRPEGSERRASVHGRPLSRAELQQLWAHVGGVENFWTSLAEIEPGAIARLAALVVQRQWEVLFITQRPATAGETVQIQSQRWLDAHGFRFPAVFVVKRSRGLIASALAIDVVIDDRSENCFDVATDSTAKPLLVWRGRGNALPPGIAGSAIEVVSSVSEAFDRIERMSDDREKPPSLLRRLRHAIGIDR